MPRVSVIIPAYNRGPLLLEAIESVRRQTFQDFEVVVVDDGSTEDIRSIAETVADGRVRYFRQQNGGLSRARNRGLAEARGDFLTFLDSDDVFLPNKLEVQVRELDERPGVGLIAGGWLNIDGAGRLISKMPPRREIPLDLEGWLLECPFVVHAPLIRHEWARKVGGFDPQQDGCEDWDYWLRLARCGCRMEWGTSIVCSYRHHGGNTGPDGRHQPQNQPHYRDKLFTTLAPPVLKLFSAPQCVPPPILARRNWFLARAQLISVAICANMNDIQGVRARLNHAVELYPAWRTTHRREACEILANAVRGISSADLNRGALAQHPRTLANVAVASLPPRLRHDRAFKQQLAVCLTEGLVYDHLAAGDLRGVRRELLRLLALCPRWFASRAALSVCTRAVLGEELFQNLRATATRAGWHQPTMGLSEALNDSEATV